MHTHRWQCSHSSTRLHLSVGLRRCCFSFSFSSSHTPSQSNATVIRLHNRWRVLSTIKTSTTSIQRAEKMKRKKVTKWQACSVCCAQQLQCDRDWRCRPKARRESIVSRWYSSKSNVASHANRDCLCEATGAFAHTQFNEPFCNSNNNHTIRNLNVVVFVSSRFHLSGVVARLRCVAWWLSLFLSPSVCVCFGYCIRFPFKWFFCVRNVASFARTLFSIHDFARAAACFEWQLVDTHLCTLRRTYARRDRALLTTASAAANKNDRKTKENKNCLNIIITMIGECDATCNRMGWSGECTAHTHPLTIVIIK